MKPKIKILQGRAEPADICVIIDVIRAFTTAHTAFERGAAEILLAESAEDALRMKRDEPELILVGEIEAEPIPGFDFGNSPSELLKVDLRGKRLVQRTTNGVRSVFEAEGSGLRLVCGLCNVRVTAAYLRKKLVEVPQLQLNLVATHPESDEDLACAEYLEDLILERNSMSFQELVDRVRGSKAAQKFFDVSRPVFPSADIEVCQKEANPAFVLRVEEAIPPRIVRQESS